MKRIIAVILAGCLMIGAPLSALPQEKANNEEPKINKIPLRVKVVFTEFEGEKKVKSLPYVIALDGNSRDTWSKLRVGTRIPIYVGGKDPAMTYLDVGTNIDCRVPGVHDGKYELDLLVERSWVDGEVVVPTQGENDAQQKLTFRQPIIRQYRAEMIISLRDGQTQETNFSTDPVNGRIVKLEIGLNVEK